MKETYKKQNKQYLKREANLVEAFEKLIGQKSLGGNILSLASSFLPGGQFIAPAIAGIDSLISNKETKPVSSPLNLNTNPYGKMFKGGVINNGFKQYNTGSHSSGNDLSVDHNGNPNSINPSATVQNKENMFKIEGKPYVMSDTLLNPETGNMFNVDAAKLNRKYPNAKFRQDEKNAIEFGMKRLAGLNDFMRNADMVQKACGGSIKKMYNGGNPGDPVRNRPYMTVDGRVIQETPMTVEPIIDPISPNIPTARNPLDIKINDDFLPANYQVADPDPLEMDNTILSNEREIGTPAAPVLSPNTDVLSAPETTSAQPKERSFGLGADAANAVAIGLKAAGLTKSIVDAFTPAEKEMPILPNYQLSDNYMRQANVNYNQARQDATGASNIAANVNRSSSNFASFQARESARVANLQDALSRISQAENNEQSRINMAKANYEQGKAVDNANRLYQNRINNQQNQANADFADQKLFTELTQIGTEFNKYANFKKQVANNKELQTYYINEGLAILNNKYPNFKLDSSFITKLQSGQATADDVVKFWSTVQSLEKKDGNN